MRKSVSVRVYNRAAVDALKAALPRRKRLPPTSDADAVDTALSVAHVLLAVTDVETLTTIAKYASLVDEAAAFGISARIPARDRIAAAALVEKVAIGAIARDLP